MSHVSHSLSSACWTGKELSLQARYPSGTDQSDKTLLLDHVASSRLVTASSESRARLHLALGSNDHTVPKQPTGVEFRASSDEKSHKDKVNVNCSHDLSQTTVTTGESMSDSLMIGTTRDHSVFLMHVSPEPTRAESRAISYFNISGSVDTDLSESHENIKVVDAVESNFDKIINNGRTVEAAESKSDTSAENIVVSVAVKSAKPNSNIGFENIDVIVAEEEAKPNGSDHPELINVDELMLDKPTCTAEPEMYDMNVVLTAETFYREPLGAVAPENTDINNDAMSPEPSIAESSDQLNVEVMESAEQYEHDGVSTEV